MFGIVCVTCGGMSAYIAILYAELNKFAMAGFSGLSWFVLTILGCSFIGICGAADEVKARSEEVDG
jgi:hypothetical protein